MGEKDMDIVKLQSELLRLTNSLFQQGVLDDQFTELKQLQDESNPDFVAEVFGLFFEDSERILNDLATTLSREPVDFKTVDANVHQLKGSSSSIGAVQVKNVCVAFRLLCEVEDLEGCRRSLDQVKQEYTLLKRNLEKLLELELQVTQAGASVLMIQ